MEVLVARCAGLDVANKSVVACALVGEPGAAAVAEVETFGTLTVELAARAGWLAARGVTAVVMEATGAYWKPVYSVLERHGGVRLVVGNAAPLKGVPGRKTDVEDARRPAELPRHGPVRPSFVPDREQRELTRYRTAPVRERASEVNRLLKTPEAATIELAAVLTDVTGASGQAILDALVNGEADPRALADLAHGRVQRKRAALERSLVGQLAPTLTRRRARTREGSPWRRAARAEAAWAARRGRDGSLPEHFRRLAARRGSKRAIVAVGHSVLVIAYSLLKRGTTYADLGAHHFDTRDADRVRRRSVQRLDALGFKVTLERPETAP